MKLIYLLPFFLAYTSCSTTKPGTGIEQPENANYEAAEVPKKTLRDYPDILEFEIVGISDDHSMTIAIVAFEFVEDKVLGEKRQLKFNSPNEIVLGEIVDFQGQNFVEIFADGLKYLTVAKR